ncbi:hypothetical protein [Saccharothrix obliqua]|nr:hypothetical protein [Saccharothrix obliqua]
MGTSDMNAEPWWFELWGIVLCALALIGLWWAVAYFLRQGK